MSVSALSLSNVSKIFYKSNQKFVAVEKVNLALEQGEICGFLGHNGAGKTTTIKMICGLITPTTGEILVNGINPFKKHGAAMKHLGAVLEGARNIYWQLSPWENLLYFGRMKGISGVELEDRARLLLHQLDLWARKDGEVANFSRGMQQKVAIACALISNPSIVLLDEPTLGLDVAAARNIRDMIKKMSHEKKTILLTTHQLDIAEQICERIVIVNKGKIVADKTTQELLNLFSLDHFQIRLNGILSGETFLNLRVANIAGNSILSGEVESQEKLLEILDELNKRDLKIISVNKVSHSLEEVFLRVTGK